MTDVFKLGVVTGTFHPDAGGPPTYLRGLLQDLAQRGHLIRVITYGSGPSDYEYDVTRVARNGPMVVRLGRFAFETIRLARWSDVLYVSDYGAPVWVTRAIHRRPYVLKIVGDHAWERATNLGLLRRAQTLDEFQTAELPWQVRSWRWAQSRYARAARTVIVPSEYLKRIVSGWGVSHERIRVVHNALNPATLKSRSTRAEARLAAGLPLQTPIVIAVARLTPWKRIDIVLEAFREVRNVHSEASLHVVGDGPQRASLQALASDLGLTDAVKFHGSVNREQALLLMRAADVLVLFSSYEGFSHVLLEAAETGTTVIASDAGGNSEFVRNGSTGVLVRSDRPEELGRHMTELLGDKDLRELLAAGARRRLSEFSWVRMVDETVEVLTSSLLV